MSTGTPHKRGTALLLHLHCQIRHMAATEPCDQVTTGRPYEFGKNWRRFLTVLNEDRILAATRSLAEMLGTEDLHGMRFLDVGAGSGVFSLAAARLGAHVHSFDYDEDSVACAEELRQRFFPDSSRWVVDEGSVLDCNYLSALGKFDIVYAWGVLHHTGAMWQALENVLIPLGEHAKLFVAIYNDQGRISKYWQRVKRLYAHYPSTRLPLACAHIPYLACTRLLPRLLNARSPSERGMSPLHDLADWLGGYPFEVAKPGNITRFYEERGLRLFKFRPAGDPSGNNEFVFVK
jgi:SAM-dependent methyltransferase